MSARLRALLFDLDDTLIDSTSAYRRARARLPLPASLYERARLRAKKRIPHHSSSHNRLLYLKEALMMTNRFSAARTLALFSIYERSIEDDARRQWRALKRGALFAKLAKRYTLAIVTNETARSQLIKLRAIDPNGTIFKGIFTSEEVGAEKPDPRPFQAALERLKLKPAECLMIGDDPNNDVRPAARLGMRALLVRQFSRHAVAANKFPSIESLDDLPRLLGLR